MCKHCYKMLRKTPKLTPMVRFPNRTGSLKKDAKSNIFLKLNDSEKIVDSIVEKGLLVV